MFKCLPVSVAAVFLPAGQIPAASQAQPDARAAENEDASAGWEAERYYIPDEGVREGEMIISMSADIDGDGTVEKLVTTNYQRNGKYGNMWTVYDAAGGRFKELGDLQFDWDICGIFVEQGFDTSPRLYSLQRQGNSLDLIAFSISEGKVITETAKSGVDFSQYFEMMKANPAVTRTRAADEVYNLYTRDHVNQLVMTAEEGRTAKTKVTNHPANTPPRQIAGGDSSVTGRVPDRIRFSVAAGILSLLAIFHYLRGKPR